MTKGAITMTKLLRIAVRSVTQVACEAGETIDAHEILQRDYQRLAEISAEIKSIAEKYTGKAIIFRKE